VAAEEPIEDPKTEPTRCALIAYFASTLTSSSGKRPAEEPAAKDEEPTIDLAWCRIRENPAVGRQVHFHGDNN